jgi:hypothetical protein
LGVVGIKKEPCSFLLPSDKERKEGGKWFGKGGTKQDEGAIYFLPG